MASSGVSSLAATRAAAAVGDGLAPSYLTGANAGGGSSPAAAAAATDAASGGTVTLLLQLTDVHISAMEGPAGDHQRAPDLVSLSSALLARWPLAAAVVTGDLTEAKDVYGRGDQDEREWQVYDATWKALSSVGGVSYGQIYDIRGNHDTFNSGPRCGGRDHYCRYSARAARSAAGGKKNATAAEAAAAATAAVAAAGRATAAALQDTAGSADRGPRGRIFTDPVYGRSDTTTTDDRDGGGGDSGGSGCPVAVLVGVDASLDPGMRSPTNFLGVVTAAVLDELDEQLTASLAGMRAAGCSPSYIAYGHYPLSTIAYPGRRAAAGASVQQVLVRHGVSAYLSGHLHGAFGRKLHRLHAAPPSATTDVADVASSYLKSRHQEAAVVAADRPVGHMLELEMVDWKYGRTVRLMTLDLAAGGAIGFADFQYRPPTPQLAEAEAAPQDGPGQVKPPLPPQLEPFDRSAAIGSYLPLITCPPDARYSPQLTTGQYGGGAGCGGAAAAATGRGSGAGPGGAVTAVVRVMLLPMGPGMPAVPADAVYLRWACGGATLDRDGGGGGGREGQQEGLPSSRGHSRPGLHGGGPSSRGEDRQLSGVARMRLEFSTSNYSTFIADLLSSDWEGPSARSVSGVHSCPAGLIVVQVRVGGQINNSSSSGDGDGFESASPERMLRWYPPPPAASAVSHQRLSASASPVPTDAFWAVGDGAARDAPVPLQQTWLEWLVMHMAWHRFGCIAFAVQWCVLALGMLAAPRAIAVLKARRPQSRDKRQQQRRRRRNGNVGSDSGSGEECETELSDTGGEAGAVDSGVQGAAAASRHLDWEGEGASTSVCLGGALGAGSCGGKSTALKRNSSGSSSGCGGNGAREGHISAGADLWVSGVANPATPRGLHHSPFRRDGDGGGDGRGRGEDPGTGSVVQPPGAGNGGRVWRKALGVARHWLLWPVRDLAELAEHRDHVPWLALIVYSAHLAVGPWLAAEFVGPAGAGGDEGDQQQLALRGYGILTAYGIYMRPLAGSQSAGPPAGWVVAPSQDYVVIVNVVMLTCVAPALLLCASAAARLRRMAARRKLRAHVWEVLSWRQAAALCGIAVLDLLLCWKLWAGLSWAPLLMSPAVGWLLPLLLTWLWLTWSRAGVTQSLGRNG